MKESHDYRHFALKAFKENDSRNQETNHLFLW